MGVAQVELQAAEAAINIKRSDFFTAPLLLSFADQSEYPLWNSTNWERATNLQSSKQSSNSCLGGLPTCLWEWRVSLRFSINVSTAQLFLLKKKKKKKANRNSYTMLFCTAFLIMFATDFCITAMTGIHHHKITISFMWARFRQHSVNMSWAFIK